MPVCMLNTLSLKIMVKTFRLFMYHEAHMKKDAPSNSSSKPLTFVFSFASLVIIQSDNILYCLSMEVVRFDMIC